MTSNRPVSSFFQHDPHRDLLEAVQLDDDFKFNQILGSENIDVNKAYDNPPGVGTILEVCCVEEYRSKYIPTLLSRGANPNTVNNRTKKAPIHNIAIRDDASTMQMLIDCEKTDVNLLDNFGNSALHYAVKNNNRLMVRSILSRANANPNLINRKGKTPLHIVLDKEPAEEYLEVIKILIDDARINLSFTDPDGVTLRDLIEDAYPVLRTSLPTEIIIRAPIDIGQLFQTLRRNDYDQFRSLVKDNKRILEGNDGQYTLLQYCCEYGIDRVAEALLDEGVDPNGTCTTNIYPPIMIACRKGYVSIVKMLVNSKKISYQPVNSRTVLHCLVNGGYETDALGGESGVEIDHHKCLTYILKKVPPGTIHMNFRDESGNTALHYAAKMGDQNLVLEMLAAGAYIGICNKLNEPACADITRATMEEHLNNCIYTNEKMPRDEMYAMVFDYSCLVPFNKKTVEGAEPIRDTSDHFIETPINQYGDNALYRTGETDPLIYMSQNNELRPLLTHPIFTSYLYLKWRKLQPLYVINLIFYTIFVAFLTGYILYAFVDSPSTNGDCTIKANSTTTEVFCVLFNLPFTDSVISTLNSTTSEFDQSRTHINLKITALESGTTEPNSTERNSTSKRQHHQEMAGTFSHFLAWCLGFLLLLFCVREVAQFVVSPLKYITNPENWLEIGIFILTCLILTSGNSDMKHQIAAIAILASWLELVLLIGRHPALSINIEMLKTVSWTFFKFLAWYSILIVAFALCFFTLFKDGDEDGNQFQRPFISIFKTIVMLTGEFDSASIPFILYPVTSHILFILFVFLIAIVLFNLLNGLAVSDTQAIKAEAELVGYISQAKLISLFEELVPKRFDCWGFCRRTYNFSVALNMFRDITNGKIEIYLNNGNKVEFDSAGLGKNRSHELEPKCFEQKDLFMDKRITKAAREIINSRDHETNKLRAGEEALPTVLRNLLDEFKDCLQQYQAINERMGMQLTE